MADPAAFDHNQLVLGPAMDEAFYRAVYPDMEGHDVVFHYATAGWREGRDPAPWFSTNAYLARYPDVAAQQANPFLHFLTGGRAEGRLATPSDLTVDYLVGGKRIRDRDRQMAAFQADRALVAGAFDSVFYLFSNPDVAATGIDPVDHFLLSGWRENRDPSRGFSVRDYLELNPDVAAAGVQPFIHYLVQGRAEGRIAKRQLGFRHEVVERLQTMKERLGDAEVWARAVPLSPVSDLAGGLSPSRSDRRHLHITFSHDNYAKGVGGVQACVQREAARFAELGRDHLHLYPASPWPLVSTGFEGPPLGVLWNGEPVGAFRPAEVVEGLRKALAGWEVGERSFAIHSMLGHSSREVIDVVRIAGINSGHYWTHDFTSLCAGIHLLRNDVEDCGAPPPDSAACGICVYRSGRELHMSEHARLFRHLDLTVVSPSRSALDTWTRASALDAMETRVMPLAHLTPGRGRAKATAPGPFRFAFPGTPSLHKGWPIFRELAIAFDKDPRYTFVHLATTHVPGLPIEHHPVSATAKAPMAMRDALKRLDIDAAMIWSICRETFSLTAYETTAAGVAIITGPDSGNVAAFTREGDRGLVLPDEAALFDLFATGQILELARARRAAPLYNMTFNNLTADLETAS